MTGSGTGRSADSSAAAGSADGGILRSSAVMAAGTVVSRMSGFVRSALLAAALGTQLHADVFTIANTVPNMLYILLAGGVFNAVLVPQLVRAGKHDPDGGEGYTNRIVTLAALFLGVVTVALVVAAPYVMRLFLDGSFFTAELSEQRESVIDFARFCLPQVFFYGMFVLVGQVLNARGRFGPMMWAPIANNLISVVVLVVYLVAFGPAEGAGLVGGFSQREELVLGLGSTLGIAAQLLVLVPYLRAAGFHYRPRFDFRGTGLGHTMRLATWTVLFVIVNQVAYTVVVRLASAGTAEAAAGGDPGTGYTIYSGAFLLVMVPHSIVTVSLTTAVLPRLSAQAADGDHPGVAASVASTLRTTLAMVVPFAVLLPLLAPDLSNIVWGYLAAKENVDDYARSLALFAPGLVFFTTHYLVLRGFYALERNRTVFWVQCVIAAVNVALALAFTSMGPPAETAPSLVLAYVGAYLIGAAVSYFLLARLLGGLQTPVLVRFLVRLLLAAGPAMLLTWAARALLTATWEGDDTKLRSLVVLVVLAVVGGCVFLAAARAMRITEVTSVVRLLTSRVRR